MHKIDWSFVSTVISSITAMIAIAAPIITSSITIRSQERMKKNELYAPRVYDALADLSVKYSQIPRRSTATDVDSAKIEYLEVLERHGEFMAACYTVMSLIPGEGIQRQIMDLLSDLEHYPCPDDKHDKMFCRLMNDINEYLLTSKVKKPKQYAKDQC